MMLIILDPKENGCVIKDYKGGKLELVYKVSKSKLDIKYMITFSESNPG